MSWLSRLLPASTHTRPLEWGRSAFGAFTGVLASAWLCSLVFGSNLALHFLGPLAASSVLLFAVYSGPLAQPWSIMGSYALATACALLTILVFGSGLASACVAVGLALMLMPLLRCLHPPAGAVALIAVLADGDLGHPGWALFGPVLLNAGVLLAVALAYNNLTGARYPRLAPPAPVATPLGVTAEDVDRALDEIGEFMDIGRDDLERIVEACERQARLRLAGKVVELPRKAA